MDYLKLSIYLEARRMYLVGDYNYLCSCIIAAMENLLGEVPDDWQELFPEFVALYDGWRWDIIAQAFRLPPEPVKGLSWGWWTEDNREARLRFLDLVISRLY